MLAQEKKDKRPNVVLIMVDDLGKEAFTTHGNLNYSTPVLDKMAAEGLSFDNCYSQPICTPSRVKIMTGKWQLGGDHEQILKFGWDEYCWQME